VEFRQDQLDLAGIPVDVADGENARHAGFETLGVDRDVFVILQLDAQSATVQQVAIPVAIGCLADFRRMAESDLLDPTRHFGSEK
jgi:hypothetical protein